MKYSYKIEVKLETSLLKFTYWVYKATKMISLFFEGAENSTIISRCLIDNISKIKTGFQACSNVWCLLLKLILADLCNRLPFLQVTIEQNGFEFLLVVYEYKIA